MRKDSISKQTVSIKGDIVEIYREDLGIRSYTSYKEGMDDFVKELTESLWTPSTNKIDGRKYMQRSNKGETQRLHELVCCYLYGDEVVNQKHDQGFIIEHIDNDSLNNKFENLAFLSCSDNNRKARGLDKMRAEKKGKIITDIRHGVLSENFQINIRFNEQFPVAINGEEYTDIYELNFLYDSDMSYEAVLAEAQRVQEASDNNYVCFNEDEHGFIECRGIRMPINTRELPILFSTHAVKEWL